MSASPGVKRLVSYRVRAFQKDIQTPDAFVAEELLRLSNLFGDRFVVQTLTPEGASWDITYSVLEFGTPQLSPAVLSTGSVPALLKFFLGVEAYDKLTCISDASDTTQTA